MLLQELSDQLQLLFHLLPLFLNSVQQHSPILISWLQISLNELQFSFAQSTHITEFSNSLYI